MFNNNIAPRCFSTKREKIIIKNYKMKTKSLLFCLLFLVLGTTTALADKYYMPTGRVTGTLETGKKYMMYNTTYDGEGDRTGFIYNDGVGFGLAKYKHWDKMVYNEAFVFVLHDAGDDDAQTFYIESVSHAGYVNVEGTTSTSPTTMRIFTWDQAIAGDKFNVSNDGVVSLDRDNNADGIMQAFVKSQNDSYSVIQENLITSAGNHVYVIRDEDTQTTRNYFNGTETDYDSWDEGHPFAFYEVSEVTSFSTPGALQDLHIFSRCDLYSAQKAYGYVQDANKITSNPSYTDQGDFKCLIDGNLATFNITDWHVTTGAYHYYQLNLGTAVNEFRLFMQRRPDGKHAPKEFTIMGCAAGNDPATESNWVEIALDAAKTTTDLDQKAFWISPTLELGADYQYIRIVATKRTNSTDLCLALAELYVLPADKDIINNTLDYMDNSLPVVASEADYTALVNTYNESVSAMKLLSGVPIPGNKYRIYADAYSIAESTYKNQEVYTNGTDLRLAAEGAYSNADAANKSMYEWYCEETSDGFLTFRNAANPTLYLGNAGVVTTPHKWSINTSLTQRHGVPLLNEALQYLAAYNDGSYWMGNVKEVQNQTLAYASDNGTPDDTSDDSEAAVGVCTDFVFLPVDYTANEIKVTVVAEDLVIRNSTFTVDGVKTALPYSNVFINGVSDLKIESTAGTYHTFAEFYKRVPAIVDGEEVWQEEVIATTTEQTITNDLYTNSTLQSGDTIHVRFNIVEPFVKSTDSDIKLYRIMNMRPSTILQQVGPSRTSSADLEINNDEQVSSNNEVHSYASFASRDSKLDLIYDETELTANSLFYFTNKDGYTLDNINVYINSATTPYQFKSNAKWEPVGELQHVAPNNAGGYTGYTISKTKLNAINNPADAWCSNPDMTVWSYYAEDAGAAWEFVEVEGTEAKELLKKFIQDVAKKLIPKLEAMTANEGIDAGRIASAIQYIQDVAGEYTDGTFDTSGQVDADITVAQFVGYAQSLHMLKHEVEYAMQKLPELTIEQDKTSKTISPTWYYIKNVDSQYYAQYTGAENLMGLTAEKKTLAHLFYIAGEEKHTGKAEYDETYLEAHIHNFKALNMKSVETTADSTLVGVNRTIFSKEVTAASGTTTITSAAGLSKNIAWEVTATYDLSNGKFNSGWGSSLMASGDNPAIDGGTYNNGFQVFLQASGNVVVRGGVSGANDTYKFTHTVGKFSTITIVVSYANNLITVSVTNSDGVTETKNIPSNTMADIEKLTAALPAGSTFNVNASEVTAMKWAVPVTGRTDDLWYILPSTNTTNKGLAIVMNGADDTNMGWTNVNSNETEIFTAPGNDNYSTWQFEPVPVDDFEELIAELLSLYDVANCVIYDKKLVNLYNGLAALNAGDKNETTFNAMMQLIRGYDGPSPDELKAPKPGKFYTIHHIPVSMPNDFKVSDRNVIKVNEDVNNGEEFDSRGVWTFEGTAEADGFLPLSGILLKSLHTQSHAYTAGFTADSMKLSDTENATIEIEKGLGGAEVYLKVGESYLATGSDNKQDYIVANGEKLPAKNYIETTFSHESGANATATSTLYNNINVASTTLAATLNGSDITTFKSGGSITSSILCPTQRASDTDAPEFVFTLTYTGLPAGATYNNVALDIHAFNGSGEYQEHNDTPVRQWNVVVKNDSDTELGELTDIDIAKGVNPGGDRHKVWDVALETPAQADADGNLTVKIVVTKGTTNNGCFFGLSSVALSTAGEGHDLWYIEEIEDPTTIVYNTSTNTNGHSTLMLGFNATIPTGVEAFYATGYDGKILDEFYLSMKSYGEPSEVNRVLPANTPVILRNTDKSIESKEFKFYYTASTAEQKEDLYMHGSLYFTPVKCNSFDSEYGSDVNIYMLHKDNADVRMYWVWENYDENGNQVGENMDVADGEGYVLCHANKAFITLPYNDVGSVTKFSFRFPNSDTTLIEDVEAEEEKTETVEGIFDLQGRRIKEITQPGIYIVNGKKVFVK